MSQELGASGMPKVRRRSIGQLITQAGAAQRLAIVYDADMPNNTVLADNAKAILHEIAGDLRRPPRELSGDPIAITRWLRRIAGRIEGVAEIRAAQPAAASVARHGLRATGSVMTRDGREVRVEARRTLRVLEERS